MPNIILTIPDKRSILFSPEVAIFPPQAQCIRLYQASKVSSLSIPYDLSKYVGECLVGRTRGFPTVKERIIPKSCWRIVIESSTRIFTDPGFY